MDNIPPVAALGAHLGLDLLAVTLLTFGIFYPRHRRRELVPAYLALNVALFAVVAALGEVGKGGGLALGFGLFGVLSIVRLRSDALRHQEVAYYFVTLVLGLLCGLRALGLGVTAALAALLLVVVYVADHPRLYARDRRAVVTLDAVYVDEDELRAELARRMGRPHGWTVREIDYVRDLMVVEVRFRQSEAGERPGERSEAPIRTSRTHSGAHDVHEPRSTTKTAAAYHQETV
ncbi:MULTISPECIES: DUF4956 domain-containing protein [unclassified Streptomyces]|uniref:DUF4956 domain-containing protein n=1 Tax=unclassified Streptomyces TaxID=2593676 RepID=UPI00278C2E82|nr:MULTISPECIES: DUF4956 domain-containing protein [unclassified Streptomyces]